VTFVRLASWVWSPHQEVYLARTELDYSASACYESKCLLLELWVLSDRRKITAALFVCDILCWRIESAYLADLLRFESDPRRRNARLMNFYHRTNYGQNEPENKEILIFNEYCGLFGFRDDESRYVFGNGFSRALSGERSYLL
jgi:hypothetical protein